MYGTVFLLPEEESFGLCSPQQDIALTTENPEKCTILDYLIRMYSWSKMSYWRLYTDEIHHSDQEKFIETNMKNLQVGQSVGLLVTPDGNLHLFLDGKHREVVWSGLPTDEPLWGVADVRGNCTKIKADILCG